MERIYPVKIGDIIEKLISNDEMAQRGLLEGRAIECWREAVGNSLAEATQRINMRDGKLYVSFKSQAARNEFFARRVEIKERLNTLVGAKIVKFISVF